eukprot:jgi/Astpho2/2187/Aster-03178
MTVSSLTPVKQRLRVYNTELLQELIQPSKPVQFQEQPEEKPHSSGRDRQASPQDLQQNQSDSLQRRIARNKLQNELNRVGELTRKQLQATMQRLTKQRESDFVDMYDTLRHGLYSKEGIVEHVTEVLRQTERARHKKQAALYREWDAAVFQKIQDRIQACLRQRSIPEIEARLATLYQEYLDTVNAKQGVFRDTVIEADYDPFQARQHYIRVPTGDITDPVKRDIEKTLRERRLLGIRQPPRRPVSAEGKETLSTLLWNKLDSTPCGHHMDTRGAYVLKPMTAADAELRKSHVVFDHYNVARGAKGKDLMLAENTINGGLKLVDGPEVCSSRHPDAGKARAPGPEVKRGRTDLSETLLQLSNPYKDGRTLGDQWLEARGKQRVPGPEMSRGRRNLTATIQQKMDPVRDRPAAVATGDRWIEDTWSKGKAAAEAAAIPGHREFFDIVEQRYPNPYRSQDPQEKVGDLWLTQKGKGYVAGASRGVGRETAKALALQGADVYVASRNTAQARLINNEVRNEARSGREPGTVEAFYLDLADLHSVAQFAEELKSRVQRIDILCANAGIAGQPYKKSKQGYEQEFAVITLGHWLLVNKLLNTLVASQARVVVVASHLHSLASDCTPDYKYSTAIIGGWLAYCRSKLGKIWWARELQRRYPQLTVPYMHPGVVNTSILTTSTPVVDQLLGLLKPLIFISPKRGAQTELFCATSPQVKGNTYYHNVLGEIQTSKESRDDRRAQAFWQTCEKLCAGF